MPGSSGPLPTDVRGGWTEIHTGFSCNNRCLFCAQGGLRAASPAPTVEQVIAALEAAGPLLVFMGGEPTLRDDLPAWIELARGAGRRRIVLQTNGRRLAYRAYAETLAAAGLDALDISLHGARADIHDHHTRARGSFGQTMAGIASARGLGLEVGISSVITRSNFRHLPALVQRAARAGVQRLHLALARPAGEARRLRPRVIPLAEMVEPHLRAAAARARRAGVGLVVSGLPNPPAGVARLCPPPREDLFAGPGRSEDHG